MQPNGLVRGHIGSRVGYVHTRTQSVNTQTQSVSKLGYLGARFGYSGNTQDSFEGKNLINVLMQKEFGEAPELFECTHR